MIDSRDPNLYEIIHTVAPLDAAVDEAARMAADLGITFAASSCIGPDGERYYLLTAAALAEALAANNEEQS